MAETTVTPASNISRTLAAVSAKITSDAPTTLSAQSDDALGVQNEGPSQSTGKAMVRRKAQPKSRRPRKTKASIVEAMLRRKTGATLDQIGKATNWQPHTCRAFLTGLRKKGKSITREENRTGKSVYRVAQPASLEKPK